MDWNGGGSLRAPFVSRPVDQSSFSFLYNYNYDQFPVLEMKQPSITQATSQQYPMMPTTLADKNNTMMNSYGHHHDPKKKRLSTEQLESLENSFQEDIKLDPDRKMKLAKELGMQPRQIAVWFQNRRARWKGKQLERLYDALKQEYDVVSREKQKLQQEVMALRAMVKEQMAKKQVSTGYTEISGEETVESTSISNSDKPRLADHNNDVNNQISECNNNNYYVFNVDDYNPVMMTSPYWAAMPSNCP